MKLDKNCECCRGSYGSYTIGQESEIYHDQCIIPISENGKILKPTGLCGFCNPKSTVWYTPKLKCHKLLIN